MEFIKHSIMYYNVIRNDVKKSKNTLRPSRKLSTCVAILGSEISAAYT
jgi:hypothetical protein